ncbi:MAG: O-antigen ligase family protein [Microbacteriaceae bacterium]
MNPGRTRLAVSGLATLVIFSALAGDFWRDLLSWWGYGIIVLVLLTGSVFALVILRPRMNRRRLPKSLIAFLLLCLVSIAWSFYPWVSALAVLVQWATILAALFLALVLTWTELLRAFGSALRWVLGLSLLFEFIVAAFIRHPVLPFWVDWGDQKIPEAFYWSRGLLFHGGQIQGILGNSNLLAMCALLAVIVFGVQLAGRAVTRRWGTAWLVVAIATLGLTRSSTVIAATVITGLTLLAALWARSVDPARRRPVYLTGAGVLVAAIAVVWVFWAQLLTLLGKSEDLTGRLTIWHSVADLAQQRPVSGWGWISYWAPWVEPFRGLAVRKGVTYLQAHNAWLDIWLQLGIIGLVVFIALVLSTLTRSWFYAVDTQHTQNAAKPYGPGEPLTAMQLLPLLVVAALIAQSFAESRILVESGWMLLVLFSIKTKQLRA